jgi:hypothetical protein
VHVKGTLQFGQGDITKTIEVTILEREDEDTRDETFGI